MSEPSRTMGPLLYSWYQLKEAMCTFVVSYYSKTNKAKVIEFIIVFVFGN
jgi:hypothetical protein